MKRLKPILQKKRTYTRHYQIINFLFVCFFVFCWNLFYFLLEFAVALAAPVIVEGDHRAGAEACRTVFSSGFFLFFHFLRCEWFGQIIKLQLFKIIAGYHNCSKLFFAAVQYCFPKLFSNSCYFWPKSDDWLIDSRRLINKLAYLTLI